MNIESPRGDFVQSGWPHQATTERTRNGVEATLLHVRKEQFVLVRQALVVSPYFSYDAVLSSTGWTFGFLSPKTSAKSASMNVASMDGIATNR